MERGWKRREMWIDRLYKGIGRQMKEKERMLNERGNKRDKAG